MNKFKNKEEIDKFFKKTMLKFKFISDGMVTFETLNPIEVNGNYCDFNLTFYVEDFTEFFCYSEYEDFYKMQISEVRSFVGYTSNTNQLYFRRFNFQNEN